MEVIGRGMHAGRGGEGRDHPRSGGALGRKSSVGVVLKLKSRIRRALHEYRGEELISYLRSRVIDTKGKQALVNFQGARGKGATAWVVYKGIHRGD